MASAAVFCFLIAGLVAQATAAGLQCEPSKRPFSLPDDEFCDKFILCENQKASEQFCEDGLVFDIHKEKCDLPYTVDCGRRTKLQSSKPSGNCPRMNGMFAVEGTCDQFYHCTSGLATLIRCPEGVLFEPKVGACVHPDLATRTNCSASTFLGFQCPNTVRDRFRPLRFGDHDRLPHPTSCRMFYMCLLTGMPRLGGCTLGLVFNPKTGRCDKPKNVPGCEKFYGDMDDEEDDDQPLVLSSTKADRQAPRFQDSVPAPQLQPVAKFQDEIAAPPPFAPVKSDAEEVVPKPVLPEFRKSVPLNRRRLSSTSGF